MDIQRVSVDGEEFISKPDLIAVLREYSTSCKTKGAIVAVRRFVEFLEDPDV